MILSPEPNYPSTRSFLLKLHRDSTAARGRLAGRLEHLTSGRRGDFAGGEQLLALLAAELAAAETEAPASTVDR